MENDTCNPYKRDDSSSDCEWMTTGRSTVSTTFETWSWIGCLGLKNNGHKILRYADHVVIMA